MDFKTWDNSYSVGVAEFDSHHKTIFNMVGEMTDEEWLKENSDELGDALDKLAGYVTTHFAAEESYMEKYDYENYEEHLQQHVEYIKKISQLTSDWLKGSDTVQDDLVVFLRQWWGGHILEQDKKYKTAFNDGGLF